MESYNLLLKETEEQVDLWKNAKGFLPDASVAKLKNVMFDRLFELTKCLSIWIEKGNSMSMGELVLARVNLRAIVEGWLALFYCIYYSEYLKAPFKEEMINPEALAFDNLIEFSSGKLWFNKESKDYSWLKSVKEKGNAIHLLKPRIIGTSSEFLKDVDVLYGFLSNLLAQLPPLEEFIGDFNSDIYKN